MLAGGRVAQLMQAVIALCVITAVTFLCAIGKLEATSALLTIMGAGGISSVTSANVRLADVTAPPQASTPPAVPVAVPPAVPGSSVQTGR